MGYEFAMLAPVYIALVQRPGAVGLAAAAFILTPVFIWIYPDSLTYMPRLIAVFLLMACVTLGRLPVRRESSQAQSDGLSLFRPRRWALLLGGGKAAS